MHRPHASRSWRIVLSVAVAGLILGIALPARAAPITVLVQSVSAVAGTSGNTLEVDILNTGTPVDIAAFSFEISVDPGSGITFTGADISTSVNPYIFAGNSAQGPSIAIATGTTLDASDNAAVGFTTLGTGATLALGRVSFDVAGSAPGGSVTVTLTGFPATSLSAPDLSDIPIDTFSNGAIRVTPSAVPEPSTLALAAIAGSGLLGYRRRRQPA